MWKVLLPLLILPFFVNALPQSLGEKKVALIAEDDYDEDDFDEDDNQQDFEICPVSHPSAFSDGYQCCTVKPDTYKE